MRRIDQRPGVGKRSHEVFRVCNRELRCHTGAVLPEKITFNDTFLITRRDTILVRRPVIGEVGCVYNQYFPFPPANRMTFMETLTTLRVITPVHVHRSFLIEELTSESVAEEGRLPT